MRSSGTRVRDSTRNCGRPGEGGSWLDNVGSGPRRPAAWHHGPVASGSGHYCVVAWGAPSVILSSIRTGEQGVTRRQPQEAPAGDSEEFPQDLHPRIHPHLGARALAVIQVRAAAWAQPMTILTTEGLNGQGEQHVLAEELIGVDLPALEIRHIEVVVRKFVFFL